MFPMFFDVFNPFGSVMFDPRIKTCKYLNRMVSSSIYIGGWFDGEITENDVFD